MPNIVSHTLGRAGLTVTNLALGTSPLGSSPNLYGYAVDEERALDTIRAFFWPAEFADTSNNHGQGRSERAIGKIIRELVGVLALAIGQKTYQLHGSDQNAHFKLSDH